MDRKAHSSLSANPVVQQPSGRNNNSLNESEIEQRLDDLFGDTMERKGTIEIDRRVDDFFDKDSQNKDSQNKRKKTENLKTLIPEVPEKSVLRDLKSLVLSLEWEITDSVMQKLHHEITKLEQTYQNDKITLAFLRLLGSVGKYLQRKKDDAHTDALDLFNSVYRNLEKVLLSDALTVPVKRKILVTEVSKYKKLKEDISAQKLAADPPLPSPDSLKMRLPGNAIRQNTLPLIPPHAVVATSPSSPSSSHEETKASKDKESDMALQLGEIAAVLSQIHTSLDDIRTMLKDEFKALREEFRREK